MDVLIKDLCKEKKSELNYTNQTISDLTNISINTVNTYFSTASKAPSVYTVGPICAALGISLDEYFGIVKEKDPEESDLLASEISKLQEKCERLEVEADNAKAEARQAKKEAERIKKEQESQIVHAEIEKQKEDAKSQRTVSQLSDKIKSQKHIIIVLAAVACVFLALFVAYLIAFDLPNPDYGIIRSEAFR